MQKHYLSPEDETAILSLRAEGKVMKDIAKKFGICQATVSNVVNGKHKIRSKSNRRRACAPATPPREMPTPVQDFSLLPDHVLFKHVRIWDFIG